MVSIGSSRKVLIIVENLPVPLDRRVWSEATTLRSAGYGVAIICPISGTYALPYEEIDGIHIYRHKLPIEAGGRAGFVVEYGAALFHQLRLSFKISRRHGFDVIHACNPPDLIFLIGLVHKFWGRRFLFDHHDLNPELYEAKFEKRGLFYKLLKVFERMTFATASVSIATNESYRQIAIERGRMKPDRVFVVRSGPQVEKIRPVEPDPGWKKGRTYLVGYVGVIGKQEGLDLLLESVAYLVRERKRQDIQFVIVGSGPYLAALQDLAGALDLNDYVTFTGRIADGMLLTILSTAEVCVNPDRVNDLNDKSTMNKIMEYMAIGKPIVQFEVTEGRYSAQSGSLYARPNDVIDFAEKIVELLADPVRRDEMGRFGRTRIENVLSWQHQSPKLLAAYDALFGGEASRRKRRPAIS